MNINQTKMSKNYHGRAHRRQLLTVNQFDFNLTVIKWICFLFIHKVETCFEKLIITNELKASLSYLNV